VIGMRRGERDIDYTAANAIRGGDTGWALAAVQQQLRGRLAGAGSALRGCAWIPGRSLAVL
jgi:hypothetical protein